MCTEISAQIERYPSRYPPPCSGRLLMTRASATQILTSARKGNAISVALATERNSAMNRSELADLNAFVVVANHLSFRAASTQLGVTASALSHSMRQLEERHGVRLLHRTTRSVSLTDAGLRLLEQLRPAIDQISGALENLDQQRQRPSGRLRIHATHLAAAAAIVPVWARFASTYPDAHLEMGGREPCPHRHDRRGCRKMRCMNPQAARRTLALLIQVFQSAGNLINRRPQLFEQAEAGIGQRHAARGPMQQPHPVALLELAHGMAQCGSSHAKLRRRRAKAQMIGDGDECIQVCEFATIHC